MNQKELKELIEFLVEKDIAEFELERGDLKIRVKRPGEPAPIPPMVTVASPHSTVVPQGAAVPVAQGVPDTPAAKPASEEAGLHLLKSPIVGTYYEAPSPGSPAFVKVGDTVSAGQVLCIVEAMKLMNEIEADVSGEIVKILVNNGQPVEYGQPLYAIRAQ